jgi:hypothetical protein
MKRGTRNAIVAAAALYAALAAGKLVSELAAERSPGGFRGGYALGDGAAMNQSSVSRGKFNYASERILIPQGDPSKGAQQAVDQKYERVAELRASTAEFEADAARIRAVAAGAAAVVQSENAFGLAGARVLSLKLGVVPAAFDSTAEKLKGVGKLLSVTITKTDKTADFRALEARRLSLEKTRDGLAALRRAGADLSDLVALETKILEIEGQIQELGVSLGDFSEANSFCTIDVELSETEALGPGRVLAAVLDSLGWAALVELGIAAILLAAAAIAALGALAYEKVRKARVP